MVYNICGKGAVRYCLVRRTMAESSFLPGVPKKSVTPNPKQVVFFTESYCSGMEESVFGKSDRTKGHTPVEMIKLNKKYS